MSEQLGTYNASSIAPADNVKLATDVAFICKEIVTRTAQNIQGRRYVRVEGWQAIATAHGCVASARDVERTATGYRSIGEIRRMDTGQVIATAEGFVGDDEPVWSGGKIGNKTYEPRPEYAKRAMCQTRGISRACRSAFAHVVVMMNEGLETTPAEEVPAGGFDAEHKDATGSREKHDDLCSEPMIKRLYAIGKSAGTASEEIANRLAKKFPYLKTGEDIHLSLLKRTDYGEAEKVVKGETLDMSQPAKSAPPSQAEREADLLTEIWPEDEFTNETTVIYGVVTNVIDRLPGKTGRKGPYKVVVTVDDKQTTLDTFHDHVAELAKRLGAGQTDCEIAYDETTTGKFTNRKLVGIRGLKS